MHLRFSSCHILKPKFHTMKLKVNDGDERTLIMSLNKIFSGAGKGGGYPQMSLSWFIECINTGQIFLFYFIYYFIILILFLSPFLLHLSCFLSQEECQPCLPGYYCDAEALLAPIAQCWEGFFCLQGADRPDPPLRDSRGGPCPEGDQMLRRTTVPESSLEHRFR